MITDDLAERGLDVVLQDALEAADRHLTLGAHLQIEAAKSATIARDA